MGRPVADFSVEIDAPIEAVWAVMIDFARYREWNPFVVAITPRAPGPSRVGSALTLDVRWADGGAVSTVEVVTRLDAPAAGSATMEYRYTGWLPRLCLVRGSRVQTLAQAAAGRTVYRSVEEFGGLLARAVPLAKVQDGFERHGRALKSRVEARLE
jgi:hypothetical protein